MTWQDYITTDPEILGGKPILRGTRLAVDFLLGLFASGWSADQVLTSYPQISQDALRAVFAYAADIAKDEALHAMSRGAV